jgi:RimJ/RimL family protein N-acetyltransferase
MTLYDGPDRADGAVALRRAEPAALQPLIEAAGLTEHQKHWLARSSRDDTTLYFCVAADGRPVGQILLHDIDEAAGVALVGYHIFRRDDRGRGTGTRALRLLSHYVLAELGIHRLVAITGVENVASQRIAEKCGYVRTGAPREGPQLVAFELAASDQQSLAQV